jgi:hypothetical protein
MYVNDNDANLAELKAKEKRLDEPQIQQGIVLARLIVGPIQPGGINYC